MTAPGPASPEAMEAAARYWRALADGPTPLDEAFDAFARAAVEQARATRRALFVAGDFTAHSGQTLSFKIECEALIDEDIDTLAAETARRVKFSAVEGVPRGGLKLAEALRQYATPGHPTLIVDDVLTTGASMRENRGADAIGAVAFARGPYPDWVTPLFVDGAVVAAAIAEVRRATIEACAAHHEQCPGNRGNRKLEADRIRALT